MNRAAQLTTHTYPRILHESRLAFHLFQAAVHASTLRSWYVRRAIRRLMRRKGSGGSAPRVVDVGCGEGGHLFYAARRRLDATCIGIDRAADAVALGTTHAARRENVEFLLRDLEGADDLPPADLMICITVLQYIPDDEALLARMRRALRENGVLLLYVPIRNERLLPWYDSVIVGSRSDYDGVQERQRVYRPAHVRSLLAKTGFTIERVEEAYGTLGKLAFELHSLILHGLSHERLGPRIGAAAGGILMLPLTFALMLLDCLGPVSRGNGLLIEAR